MKSMKFQWIDSSTVPHSEQHVGLVNEASSKDINLKNYLKISQPLMGSANNLGVLLRYPLTF